MSQAIHTIKLHDNEDDTLEMIVNRLTEKDINHLKRLFKDVVMFSTQGTMHSVKVRDYYENVAILSHYRQSIEVSIEG